MVLTNTKLLKECDETHTHVTHYSSLKICFSSLKEKANLAIYQVKIEKSKLRIPIGYLSRFSILNSYKIEYQIVKLLLNSTSLLLLKGVWCHLRCSFTVWGCCSVTSWGCREREQFSFISLTSAGLKLKLLLPEIFENPLKIIIVLFLNTTWKVLKYFIIATGWMDIKCSKGIVRNICSKVFMFLVLDF